MRAVLSTVIMLLVCLWAGQPAAQAPGAQSKEYVTTAKQEALLKSDLISVPDNEGTVLRVDLPRGWIGDWHYHTGDVFVYVVSGEFVVDVERQGRQRFGPGQVYHEAVKTTMQARNPSATERTELILFQVGAKGEPLMFRAQPPGR